jgi:hypothetical protein
MIPSSCFQGFKRDKEKLVVAQSPSNVNVDPYADNLDSLNAQRKAYTIHLWGSNIYCLIIYRFYMSTPVVACLFILRSWLDDRGLLYEQLSLDKFENLVNETIHQLV